MLRQISALALLLALSNFTFAADSEAKRDESAYKVSEMVLETNLTKMTDTAKPKKAALAPRTCSTFDLAGDNGQPGVMHLHFVPESHVVEVYPLVYLGSVANFHFYREAGSSPYKWIWLFSPGQIFFIYNGRLYDFDDQAKLLDRIP